MRDYTAPPPPLRPEVHALLLLVGADQVTIHMSEGEPFMALGGTTVIRKDGRQEKDLHWLKAADLITMDGDRVILTDTGRERVNHAPAQTYHRRTSGFSTS